MTKLSGLTVEELSELVEDLSGQVDWAHFGLKEAMSPSPYGPVDPSDYGPQRLIIVELEADLGEAVAELRSR